MYEELNRCEHLHKRNILNSRNMIINTITFDKKINFNEEKSNISTGNNLYYWKSLFLQKNSEQKNGELTICL